MEEAQEFLTRPYIDRQQAIFVDDAVFDAENKVSAEENTEGGIGVKSTFDSF